MSSLSNLSSVFYFPWVKKAIHQSKKFFCFVPLKQLKTVKKASKSFFHQTTKRYFLPSRSKLHTHSVALGVGVIMFVAGTYFGIAHYLLPVIRALSESTHEMPYNESLSEPETYSTAFNRGEVSGLSGYDDGSGTIIATATEVTLNKTEAWWHVDYLYKQQFSISNISNEPTPTPVGEEAPGPAPLLQALPLRLRLTLPGW